MQGEYIDGYIERKKDGRYEGSLSIEGIRLPSITAVYFEDEGKKYLWIKRKKILVYEFESQTYKEREAKPYFEAYLEKQVDNGVVAYKGEFNFMRFKFSIIGVWDKIFGNEKQRLNLFVERKPMSQQTIINSINEQKLKQQNGGSGTV